MEQPDPCFICNSGVYVGPMELFTNTFEAVCPTCGPLVTMIDGPEDHAIAAYNAVARAPLPDAVLTAINEVR